MIAMPGRFGHLYPAIAEAIEAGELKSEVSKRYGVSLGTIEYACLRLGADLPPDRRIMQPKPKTMIARRGGHQVRRFSESEDALLIEMRAAKASNVDIGKRLGRPPNSIAMRFLTLARLEARAEESQ